jgi:syntaxin 5
MVAADVDRGSGSLLPTHNAPPGEAGQRSFMQQQLVATQQDSYMSSRFAILASSCLMHGLICICRAEALQNVESTIAELSSIFTQLAAMVAQQGEVAVRIDENVEDALVNVDNAQTHLLKYLNRLSSNRWLIIKIFAVLVIFMLIFIMFVA